MRYARHGRQGRDLLELRSDGRAVDNGAGTRRVQALDGRVGRADGACARGAVSHCGGAGALMECA
jgi:hypothetical protein